MPCWILLPLVKKKMRMKTADPLSDNAGQPAGSSQVKQERGLLPPRSTTDGVVRERKVSANTPSPTSWLILQPLSQTGAANVGRVYFTHGYKRCEKNLQSLVLATKAPPMHSQWMMRSIRCDRHRLSVVAEAVAEAAGEEAVIVRRERGRGCLRKKSSFRRHIHRTGLHLLSSL